MGTHPIFESDFDCLTATKKTLNMELEKPQVLVYAEKSLNYTVHTTKWVPQSNRLICLGERPRGTGAFQVWELDGPELKNMVDAEKTGAFRCGTFNASDQRQIACGDFIGKMSIIDLENHSKPIYSVDAHNGIINAIDGCAGTRGHGPPERKRRMCSSVGSAAKGDSCCRDYSRRRAKGLYYSRLLDSGLWQLVQRRRTRRCRRFRQWRRET